MESVPETERMKEFRSSPTPRVDHKPRSQTGDYFNAVPVPDVLDTSIIKKPLNLRSSTDPIPRSPGWNTSPTTTLPYRTARNSSPYSRGHARARSTASALAPPMSRAHSLPGVHSAGHVLSSPIRPSSPLSSSSHFRRPVDEPFNGSRDLDEFKEVIREVPEIDDIPRSGSPSIGLAPNNTYPRYRRPSSPLRHVSLPHVSTNSGPQSNQSSALSSPKYNESFPTTYSPYAYQNSYSSSSVSTTPSRSRSPSISSLETIEDSPDEERQAAENYIAQLKAAAEAAESADSAEGDEVQDARRNRGRTLSLDTRGRKGRNKRWSVCGGERIQDLDLETIWED